MNGNKAEPAPPAEPVQWEPHPDLKVEINALVWRNAPSGMTLGRADRLANELFGIVCRACRSWEQG